MNRQRLVLIAAIVAISGSFISLYYSLRDPAIELKPYEALGMATAEETARMVEGRKQVSVVVIGADLKDYKIIAPIMSAKIRAFEREWKRRGTIGAIEKVKIQPPSLAREGEFMLPGHLAEVLSKHPKAEVIVSFVGFSTLTNPEKDLLKGVKLAVASGNDAAYKELLHAGFLRVAIVPRTNPPSENAANPRTLREWFERDYEVIRSKAE